MQHRSGSSVYNGVAVVCGRVKWGGSGDDDAAIGDECRMIYSYANNITHDILYVLTVC